MNLLKLAELGYFGQRAIYHSRKQNQTFSGVSMTPQCRPATRFSSQQLHATLPCGIPSVPTQREQPEFLLLSNTAEIVGLIIQCAGHLWHLIHTFPEEAGC